MDLVLEELVLELEVTPETIELTTEAAVVAAPPTTVIAQQPIGSGRIVGLDGNYATWS